MADPYSGAGMGDEPADWEKQQIKTFTAWVNMYIVRSKECTPVTNIVTDFADGIRLIKLVDNILEEMSEVKQKEYGRSTLKKYNKKPRMMLQIVENLSKPLALVNRFCRDVGIKIEIAAEDVAEGKDRRVNLGLVWILISKFAIEDISEEHNLADQQPERLATMLREYRALGATDCWRTHPENGCQSWTTAEQERALNAQTSKHMWMTPLGHAPANFPPQS